MFNDLRDSNGTSHGLFPKFQGFNRSRVLTRLVLASALMLPACACSSLVGTQSLAPIVGAPNAYSQTITVRVMPGDNIATISQRHGVPASAILAANGISDGNRIRTGQILRIPAAVSGVATYADAKPSYMPYQQQPSVADMAMRPASRIPEISAPQYAQPKLRYADDNAPYKPTKPVLGLGADREIIVSARMTSLARPQIKPAQFDVASKGASDNMSGVGGPLMTSKPREYASVEPAAPVVRTQDHVTGGGQPDDFTATNQFIWPVSGKVISSFGQTSNGLVNDGINIAVEAGAPVKASDHGVVIYAGNELPGFGNLLLVKHTNGYVTAYAHNTKLLVKKGAKVRQGQVIANAGKTGNVDRAQVHFEIRRGDKPVDPKRYIESASARL